MTIEDIKQGLSWKSKNGLFYSILEVGNSSQLLNTIQNKCHIHFKKQ